MIDWLVVQFHHLQKIWVNGKHDIPYMMENKIHVPKHQPDDVDISTIFWHGMLTGWVLGPGIFTWDRSNSASTKS